MGESPGGNVVVAGHICLDIIPGLEGSGGRPIPLLEGGTLTRVGPARLSTGGAVANTGLALHRLGAAVALVGKIGLDRFGEAILDLLAGTDPSLTDHMIVSASAHTSYTVVIDPPHADRRFLHHPGANDDFRAADLDLDRFAGAHALHFGYPPVMKGMFEDEGAELESLFRRAKARGLTTSLDLCAVDPDSEAAGVDWPRLLARVLPYVDVFLPSLDEVLFMLDREAFTRRQDAVRRGLAPPETTGVLLTSLTDQFLAWGAAVTGLKLGDQGIHLRTAAGVDRLAAAGGAVSNHLEAWRGREILVPGFDVQVAGTTGSGDCAVAGLLMSLLRGDPPESAVTLAAAAGARCAESPGAASAIPPWSELRERIESGWSRRPLRVRLPGWRRDDDTGLFHGPDDSRAEIP